MKSRPAVAVVLTVVAILLLISCSGSNRPVTVQGADTTTSSGPGDDTTSVDPGTADVATTLDPGILPQTREHPGTASAQFSAGVRAMWQGIVDDDPSSAMAFFFPLSAYRQVKDEHDPAQDWKTRLVGTYDRDIHALHAQLGANANQATLIGLTVPDRVATWVSPGQEYNKLGYWRVYGSTLRYSVGGRTLSMTIYSLISWRGEWYVVHMTHP